MREKEEDLRTMENVDPSIEFAMGRGRQKHEGPVSRNRSDAKSVVQSNSSHRETAVPTRVKSKSLDLSSNRSNTSKPSTRSKSFDGSGKGSRKDPND